MEQGHPDPLGLMCLLVMAWMINCQPSSRHTGSALIWACLPTKAMAPDNVNATSLASPRLSPSPNNHHPYNRTAWPRPETRSSVKQLCHLKPCLPWLAPAMHEVVVALLSHLQWRLPVFPNNTNSQASQVLVSFPETGMVNVMGCFQIPLGLPDHFAAWWSEGGPQSGYQFQASDHL